MQAEIADAADLAAGLYLDSGQPLEARWAANQGLLSGLYTERLWVRLMAAADALGEAQEVERLLAEMDTRLGLDGDYSQLHPDTIAAYRIYRSEYTVNVCLPIVPSYVTWRQIGTRPFSRLRCPLRTRTKLPSPASRI